MNRLCKVILAVSAVAVVLSTLIVTIRSRRRINGPNPNAMLRHRVFADVGNCEGDDYTTYTTPFGQCYNVGANDGEEHYDLFDEIMTWDRTGRPTWFKRTYYSSMDGSCQNQLEGVSEEGSMWGKWCTTYGSADGSSSSEQETLIFS